MSGPTPDDELAQAVKWLEEYIYESNASSLTTRKAIITVLARLLEARKDRARIDWIDDNCNYIGGGNGGTYSFTSPADVESGLLRVAIDAAIAAAAQAKGET